MHDWVGLDHEAEKTFVYLAGSNRPQTVGDDRHCEPVGVVVAFAARVAEVGN